MKRFTCLLFLLLISLNTRAAPPTANETEYFKTVAGGFLINEGKPLYALTFEVLKELPTDSFIEVSFDNPRKKQPDIVGAAKQEFTDGNLLIESPGLECIKNKKTYEARLVAYQSAQKLKVVTEHSQQIQFNMPRRYIKQLGINKC
ncbi:MAG: hypothetical protein AAF431_12450 [Pseudomonadota bacterium]